MDKQNYQEYLKSDHWQKTRNKMLEHYNHTCVICGKQERLHVHHISYDRLWQEDFDDLVVLCEDCHSWIHSLKGDVKLATEGFEEEMREAYMTHLYPVIEKQRRIACWNLAASVYQRMGNRPNRYKNTALKAILDEIGAIDDNNWPKHLIYRTHCKNPFQITMGYLADLAKKQEDTIIYDSDRRQLSQHRGK